MVNKEKLKDLKDVISNAIGEFKATIYSEGVKRCAHGMGIDQNYLSAVVNGHKNFKMTTFFEYYEKLIIFLEKENARRSKKNS